MALILAIDQGTTSSRAILFDAGLRPVATAQEEFAQHFPDSGWVEHAPADLWSSTLATCRAAIAKAGIEARGHRGHRHHQPARDHAGLGPRHGASPSSTRSSGRTGARHPCAPACAEAGHEPMLTARTGLLADPYFSATKLAWILDHVEGARTRARDGALLFGTVDSFLIWKLTGGRVHATDATNAARTMLYDIHEGRWSAEICDLLDIPLAMLPEVRDSAADFGLADADHFGRAIPIMGVAGDQQAATVGQACFAPGMAKSTYGTGCFALLNTGARAVASKNRLLTTIAYQLDGKPTYALEGSIFVAGAVVQWLRGRSSA